MTLNELIDEAQKRQGSLKVVAQAMGKHQTRISEWKKGIAKPDASEIAFLAECAGLPVLTTVADIESQLHSKYAHVWRDALGKLTAAGVTAGLVLVPALMPDEAHANRLQGEQSVYYVNLHEDEAAASGCRAKTVSHAACPRDGVNCTKSMRAA